MSFLSRIWHREKPPHRSESPTPETYEGLRSLALGFTAEQVGAGDGDDSVYGVITEMGRDLGYCATIVGLGDGTASLYLSNGGGVIGAGVHKQVGDAARALVAFTDDNRSLLDSTFDDVPLSAGEVRMIALTRSGRLAVAGRLDDWMAPGHPMHALFRAASNLLTQIRLASGG